MKCIFEDEKTIKQNETFRRQLEELVSYFLKLQDEEVRKEVLMLKEIEETENGVRN